jgi:hypothetical protein
MGQVWQQGRLREIERQTEDAWLILGILYKGLITK